MSSAREKILLQLEGFGISPKRSLGQNFLVSENVIDKIIQAVKKFEADFIVEIGPGLGALTEPLKTFAENLVLVELDKTFAAHWRTEGIEVLELDALDVDWATIFKGKKNLLVSNLPYQISSRIVVDFSVNPIPVEGMVLMFQKEVAERIAAKPSTKDYGLLSIIAQSFWDITTVTNAGMQDFYPAPQVGSRVLRFSKKSPPQNNLLDKEGLFLRLVKAAFSQRRKFLIKNLKAHFSHFDFDALFDQLNLDKTIRAEAVPVELYASLYNALKSQS